MEGRNGYGGRSLSQSSRKSLGAASSTRRSSPKNQDVASAPAYAASDIAVAPGMKTTSEVGSISNKNNGIGSKNGVSGRSTTGGVQEKEYCDLSELAKGWKATISRATNPNTREEAFVRNDRGNLPLHSAASFRAPLEVAEALLEAYPEAASITNNYGNLALHFTAWKKGPLDVEKLLLRIFPEGAAQKNNHGNLPLHYAAHYNAPLEVVEALYKAYPEAAHMKNNDNNTPLDLAIADGASPNVVALLQGKKLPPGNDEIIDQAKNECDRMEKELQKFKGAQNDMNDELESVLALLMDIKVNQPHALYSAGIDPQNVDNIDSLLDEVRRANSEASTDHQNNTMMMGEDTASVRSGSSKFNPRDDEDIECQLIEDALIPPDDVVEVALSKVIGLDPVKNQIRGLRRTLEIEHMTSLLDGRREGGDLPGTKAKASRQTPRHLAIIGNPGSGKTFLARKIMPIFHKIGAVQTDVCIEASRDELVDYRSISRTVEKTRQVIQKAYGGVLFIDDAFTLLPSPARKKARDNGAAALREIAKVLPQGNPLIIMAGYSSDLQLVMASDIGFKGNFLLQIEFPDPTPFELARIFLSKLHEKGFVPGTGLTAEYLAELIKNNTDPDWRCERNGRISEQLLYSVSSEIHKKTEPGSEYSSVKSSMLPLPGSKLISTYPPDGLIVTVEDVHNAIVNGL